MYGNCNNYIKQYIVIYSIIWSNYIIIIIYSNNYIIIVIYTNNYIRSLYNINIRNSNYSFWEYLAERNRYFQTLDTLTILSIAKVTEVVSCTK